MKRPGTIAPSDEETIVSLPCACANLRRAARIVTQLYDQELRSAGVRVTQFTLLQALVMTKDISQGKLGDVLGLDSTTLTRTLTLLRNKGWIQAKRGDDRRQVWLALTAEGKREYLRAKPYWLSAQKRLRRALGEVQWGRVTEAVIRTAALARED